MTKRNADTCENNIASYDDQSTEVLGFPSSPVGMKNDGNKLLPNTRINNKYPRTIISKQALDACCQEKDKCQSYSDHFICDFPALKTDGSRRPLQSQDNCRAPTGTPNISASWMTLTSAPLSAGFGTKFFNESSEKTTRDSSSPLAFNRNVDMKNVLGGLPLKEDDGRRPSVASIKTSSSQSSKSSLNPAAIHKKLQAFFGDDFIGKERSDSSINLQGKDVLTQTLMRNQAHRTTSPTTDTIRDTTRQHEDSPTNRRPNTPVPSRDVVPFLYQDSQDIPKYGEAPVREKLSGPDKDRYSNEKVNVSKVSPRSLTQHLLPANKILDSDSEELAMNFRHNGRASTLKASLLTISNSNQRIRSKSPNTNNWNVTIQNNRSFSDINSPPISTKRGILGRFRKHKDFGPVRPKEITNSARSFNSTALRPDSSTYPTSPEKIVRSKNGDGSLGSEVSVSKSDGSRHIYPSNRQGTFSKLQLLKGRNRNSDGNDSHFEYSDNENTSGLLFNLDTNLNNMEGILAKPPLLTPLDKNALGKFEDETKNLPEINGSLGWNAPESWAVKKIHDDTISQAEADQTYMPPRENEKLKSYCIRIFRLDGTFATLSASLDATVAELMGQLGRKTYMTDTLANYQIVMKKHDLHRILGPAERPVVIQKRLLEQVGYEERDRIEDVGREDNSYLCRFSFIPARESGFATITADPGISRVQKYSHVDLSGRNFITIPIALYSRASEIISLNLSRNLSLDLPKDFIQSCQNLRDIKFNNNDAWKFPTSLSRAARLTILDVSNNRFEQLEDAELDRLVNLLSLKLANNRLGSLPMYFGSFKSLRTLNVSSNFLDNFPKFLCDLESLVDLDMSFNSISSLPDEICQLVNLERFVITNNRLNRSLPDTFCQLVNLKEVDIRYNTLSSIDVVASLPKVDQISADHNSISVCECEFSNIRILRLNSNPVTKFEILNLVPTLTTLNLSNAKLAHIPDANFDKMPNLVKLILDINHFVSLPIHIGKLRKLEHFSIAQNALSSLPAEIGCLTELRFLDVRQNNLKKLPIEIWWANKLETLNISSNVLENFPMPASRPPQVPGDILPISHGTVSNTPGPNSTTSSVEELGALEAFGHRRPSQLSNSLLGINGSPLSGITERRNSIVTTYGKRGRQPSIVSRTTSEIGNATPSPPQTRKDSILSSRLVNTFAKTLKNLFLADNQLDDDVFDKLILLGELRVLNLSYNDLSDIPHRSIKSWPQITELYLSGNELTSLPSDDFEEFSLLQVLYINGNRFQTLPAELGKAHRLAVLDCGNNSLKYNVSNWPYDWNWNWNTNLKYLNFSGNKRLEIKPSAPGSAGNRDGRDLTNFNALQNLRVLGLMDVTLTIPLIPDQTEDRRVRTSGSLAGQLSYGMADTLGKNEHLSIIDMVVPRFNSSEAELLMGMFDGQALASGGSKIAKYLHENFGRIFSEEMKRLSSTHGETPSDALRRAFLSLNKDLATAAIQNTEERTQLSHRGTISAPPNGALTYSDLQSGSVATVVYLQNSELYVANVGDAQGMLIHSEGGHRILTRKHDPAEPNERQRIRDAGGWVSRQGKLNDILEVSRAFGYLEIMPAVQAAPHVTHVTIKEQDEIILIASRELWEYLSPELVVDVARYERGDLMRAAQRLRDLAIAFGATNKLMVMMIGVSDLKKRNLRTHRLQGLFLNSGTFFDDNYAPMRRPRKKGENIDDSGLRRLDAEVDAPVGYLSIVFTDIKSSTLMWETFPSAMRSAIKLHNEVMRRQLRLIGGYEVKTEGDAFMVSFPTASSALLWCFAVQQALLEVQWPSEVVSSVLGQEIFDDDQTLIFKGLSVRMGVHWGQPVCEPDPVTRRMDYFGPMVNRAARVASVADGGQITVSADFISEIQRCLETYNDNDRSDSTGSEDTFENEVNSQAIRRELRSLSTQGFEVKDIGERKLKGLENPEYIYLMYPHTLSGRFHYHQRPAEGDTLVAVEGSAKLSDASQLEIDIDSLWSLWHICLRLEMLCSSLEGSKNSEIDFNSPEIIVLEKFKSRGGEMTDRIIIRLLTHQITRVEACINTLEIRHLAIGGCLIHNISQLQGPMKDIFSSLSAQLEGFQKYRAKYGDLTNE
ncbi:Adenylate cyclase [Erysiphe necator]|uniref:Adenylate cyclase n=1 Tax=Uncinula necator TaxID=52586 RepID=A0A0B1PFV7_UNCNE|nr:Adenylate cyclase [Erysiphe necator]KHJ35746.1 putative adenylate cyclase [Erysiphe necator]